jgi:hypothetical protein
LGHPNNLYVDLQGGTGGLAGVELGWACQAKKIARKKICIFNRTSFLEGVGRYEMWLDKEFPLKKMYQFSK